MPLPNDGEVVCGACHRALNRKDLNCFACGSVKLDRSKLERELHRDQEPPALIHPPSVTEVWPLAAEAISNSFWWSNYGSTELAYPLCPQHAQHACFGPYKLVPRQVGLKCFTLGCRRLVGTGEKWS